MKKITMFLFFLVFAGVGVLCAQNVRISGIVTDAADGQPLPGVSVVVKGVRSSVSTDVNGRYIITVPDDATLVFSFVGLKTQEQIVGGRVEINVVLESEALALSEVVVTALGISREKKALGYAVSEIGGDELLKTRGGLNNPVNALQGKVAGLQIQSNSGTLGGSSKILIRGVKSISGSNQPLFVIDGVPIEGSDFTNESVARGWGGYDYGNLVQDLNPDDIEEITVLKGPNASALYGSRATNGVIVVTTKKGRKEEGFGITYNASVNFETVTKLPKWQTLYGGGSSGFSSINVDGKTLNYPDYFTDESWGPRLDGQDYVSWYDLAKWEAGGKQPGALTTSKWQSPDYGVEDYYKTGYAIVNGVSMTQATDRAAVRLSYTNTEQHGYVPNSSQQKNVFNVSASAKSFNKQVEVFTNLTYLNTATKGRPELGFSNTARMFTWWQTQLDFKELENLYQFPDGTPATWNRSGWNDPTPMYSNNPYWTRYKNYQNDTRDRLYGNVGVTVAFTDYLKFQYKANLDFYMDKQYERVAVGSSEVSQYSEMSRKQHELNHEFLVSFNKAVGVFSYSANVGANLMYRHYEDISGTTVGGLVLSDFYNLSNSVSPPLAANTLREKAINSVFANATVGYKGLVYLDASLRNDWSSTLPKGNNSYLYPAVTGSFIFSELTKKAATWLSFGKFRIGYAQVGSDTDPYQVQDIYTYSNSISTIPGYLLKTTMLNPDLKPETTTSFEVGLEASFINNRVGFEATYYSSETKDQILPLTVSGTTGYVSRVINGGVVSNHGFEFRLYGAPVQTKDFEWNSTLTLTSNKIKVKELPEGLDFFSYGDGAYLSTIGALKGGEFVIMGTDYTYDDKGNKIIGADGLYVPTDEQVPLANIYPDFTGGWQNTFRYKNFDLSILFDFSKGGHYFSASHVFRMFAGRIEETATVNENGKNIRDDIANGGGILLDGVLENGSPNTQRVTASAYAKSFQGIARFGIFKTDFIKLREINFGYTFPLAKEGFVKSLRVAAYGRNLAVWGPDVKHADPEIAVNSSGNMQGVDGASSPAVANYGINITLKF
jgi:TonB-linked SusC/RagA family outer membrane protein